MENSNIADCQKIKEQVELGDAAVPQTEAVNVHLLGCKDCRTWFNQSRQIVQLSKELPQYDVPEALTQKILQAVSAQQSPSLFVIDVKLVVAAALTIALAIFAFPDTFENVEGCVSWLVSFSIILVVKLLNDAMQAHKPVHQ